jgi:membrane protein required for colicin V production
MTGFDYVVLLIVGIAAAGGFFRGFVQEALSLTAWGVGLVALRLFHVNLTTLLGGILPSETGAGVLAFALLTVVPYFAVKMLAARLGGATRGSLLGPVDRLLGFGFGAVKGAAIAVLGFSLLVFGYDLVWGADGRPDWIVEARAYPVLDAASDELMTLIAARRAAARDGAKKHARQPMETVE